MPGHMGTARPRNAIAPRRSADFEHIVKDTIRKLSTKGNLPQVIAPEDINPIRR